MSDARPAVHADKKTSRRAIVRSAAQWLQVRNYEAISTAGFCITIVTGARWRRPAGNCRSRFDRADRSLLGAQTCPPL